MHAKYLVWCLAHDQHSLKVVIVGTSECKNKSPYAIKNGVKQSCNKSFHFEMFDYVEFKQVTKISVLGRSLSA